MSLTLYCIGYTGLPLIQCRRGITKGMHLKRQGLLGTILEADHSSNSRIRKEGRERREEEWDKRKYFDSQRLRPERNYVPHSLQRLLRSTLR